MISLLRERSGCSYSTGLSVSINIGSQLHIQSTCLSFPAEMISDSISFLLNYGVGAVTCSCGDVYKLLASVSGIDGGLASVSGIDGGLRVCTIKVPELSFGLWVSGVGYGAG